MNDVDGKVAFVTGGSSGIGLGIAEALAEAGMKVVIGYRTAGHLEEAMTVLAPYSGRVHAVELDVSDRGNVAMAAAETILRFGKVHVLVNNAGVGVIKPVSETSHEDWDWQTGINLTGVFNGIHTFLPLIREHGEGGHIVSTSSVMGLATSRGHATYSATKYGVVGLMEGLRLDLADTEVGVSVYCPGNVWANLDIRSTGQELGSAYRRGDEDAEAAEERERKSQEHRDLAMEPLEAGRLVLRGILNNDLYILTHPEFGWMFKERHEAIEAAHPSDLEAPAERIANTTAVYHNPVYAQERDRVASSR